MKAATLEGCPLAPHPEVELKLEVADIRALERCPLLRTRARPPKSKDLVSVYFDTKKLKLRTHGLSLRVRRVNGHHLQTIKQNATGNQAALSRNEWEAEIDGDAPDLGSCHGTPVEPLATRSSAAR
jgi:triphosphatase